MELIGLLITVVLIFYGLKFVAHLMKQDGVKAAGDELDRGLDETASKAKGCVIRGCHWYLLLWVVVALTTSIAGIAYWLIMGP